MSSTTIKSFQRHDDVAVAARETFQLGMHDDPVARYIVKDAAYRRWWNLMIDFNLTPTKSDLNFVTENTNAAVLARIYPDEKVGTRLSNETDFLLLRIAAHVALSSTRYEEHFTVLLCKNAGLHHGSHLFSA
jgi:predicted RNA binding protein with dsRBD fold (UPF0201 family)